MASRIAGAAVPDQDDRRNHPYPWSAEPASGTEQTPPDRHYAGRERRSGRDRRRAERRFELRGDGADRRGEDDRRQGHWRCLAGHCAGGRRCGPD